MRSCSTFFPVTLALGPRGVVVKRSNGLSLAADAPSFEPRDDTMEERGALAPVVSDNQPGANTCAHIPPVLEYERSFGLRSLFSKNKGKKAPSPSTPHIIVNDLNAVAHVGKFRGRERLYGEDPLFSSANTRSDGWFLQHEVTHVGRDH